jgi:hypothetical protein
MMRDLETGRRLVAYRRSEVLMGGSRFGRIIAACLIAIALLAGGCTQPGGGASAPPAGGSAPPGGASAPPDGGLPGY